MLSLVAFHLKIKIPIHNSITYGMFSDLRAARSLEVFILMILRFGFFLHYKYSGSREIVGADCSPESHLYRWY